MALPEPTGPTVLDVLALVQQRAPGSPYAQRAATLLAALTPEASGAAPEGPNAFAPSSAAAGTYGFEGDAPLNSALGGFTWRAQQLPTAEDALTLLSEYLSRGIRAAVIEDGEAYRIIVGQFETRPDAFGVREDLPAEVQGAGASIFSLDGVDLLSVDDLR